MVRTSFWESRWLKGVSPKELASNLYNQVRYKQRAVHKELQQFNWIKNIRNIHSEELLDEFVLLFTVLNDVISWRWTTSGNYSAAKAQFLGAYPMFKASTIWQAKTEPKCCFFAWLAIQGKASKCGQSDYEKLTL
jgi:hypothetical protein